MLTNFFLIAIRNLKKQFTYSVINIAGLSIGLACSLIIYVYVFGEWNHDRHFTNGDRIYRIGVSFFNMGEFGIAPERLKYSLPKEFEGIESYTRFSKSPREVILVNDKRFTEVAYYVDSSFFDVFSYPFVSGSKASIHRPASAVISERVALRLFNDPSPMGKTMEIGKERTPFTITGVVKYPEANSHLKSEIWLSLDPSTQSSEYWTSASVYTFVLLKPGVNQESLHAALDRIIEKEIYPTSGALFANKTFEQYKADDSSVKFFVYPLHDVYLQSKANYDLSPGGNQTNLIIFSIIAVFIIGLASVNFINLATARATRRAKEVGVRKSLGTTRKYLILQFLIESVLTCMIAMIAALCLAELFTFIFHWITGQPIKLSLWTDPKQWFVLISFTTVIGILAGLYPAFYLTSFKPVNVLKGNLHASGGVGFRNGLVVFQFVISLSLIVCSIVVIQQLRFMSTKDLGFNQESIISIDNIQLLKENRTAFREELLQHKDVKLASLHSGEPGSKSVTMFHNFKTTEMTDYVTINTYISDGRFLDVMDMTLMKGRKFNPDLKSDTAAIIINESAARAFNIADNPIGVKINGNLEVIGVVRDFHWESLRNSIAPVAILLPNEANSNTKYFQLALKIENGKMNDVIAFAEKKWKSMIDNEVFVYHFMDDNFGQLLQKEETLGKAIVFFTILAIFISCLGVFGLAAYTTEQRTKEISIRKVLGASVSNIVILLNKQITVLIIIALLIATPISFFAMREWLKGFAYHTDLAVWIFIVTGFIGLLITYLTIGYHSLKASTTNPASTLKCDG